MKEKTIKIFNKVKSYPILIYFIISSVFNATLLRYVTVKNYFAVKPLLIDIGIVLLLAALSLLFKEKKRKKYFVVITIILTAICVINSMYYTFYKSYASFSMLATSIFVVDVGDAIVENVVQIKDLVFIWQPIVLLILLKYTKKKEDKTFDNNKKLRRQLSVTALIIIVICLIFTNTSDYAMFTKQWNKKGMVMNFGVYLYQMNDLVQSLKPQITNILGHDQALKETEKFYEDNKKESTSNEYTGLFEGKNVIVIHSESLQTLALNNEINNQEITPNLNKLAQEGIYFSNFYSQVGVGTSSDAEFTFSTSLMPSSNGTVFVNYYDREYETIQKLLKEKGYYVASMHANVGTFWNRATMHENMGYDKFYDKEYYIIDETIGTFGLSDKSFFNQSIKYIEEIKENNHPFYITMITLTNHTPFSDVELMDEFDTTMTVDINGERVTRDYINGTVLGNYFRSVHYADQAIGEFIQALDDQGLLEDTVIVIYGDHDARIDESYYNLYYNYDPYEDRILTSGEEGYREFNEYIYELNRKVPLIIWTKDTEFNKEVTMPMGMIDVLPTLGNMLGVKSDYQLGSDIFSVSENMVVFVDGSYVTDKIYYNSQKKETYPLTKEPISEEYIQQRSEYANKIIEISNYIINYDLIKEMKEN